MICIDLGNAITKIAICRPGYPEQYSPMEIIKIGSSVLFDSDGNFYYGQEADESLTLAKIRMYNRGFKNKLGRKSPIIIANQEDNLSEYSAQDITCKFLSSIKGEFEKNGFPLKDLNTAMITVPANFSPAQIFEFKKAAELAGFSETHIISEAEAIGYCVAAEAPLETKEKNILVADWGDNALKLSLITKNSWGKYILSSYHKTMNYCGGNSFSDALSAIFMKDVQISEDDVCIDPELCIRLNQKMQVALEKLATVQSINVQITISSAKYLSSLTSSTVEKIIADRSGAITRDISDFVASIPQELQPKKIIMSGGFMHYDAAQKCILSALPGMVCQKRYENFSNDIAIGLVRYAHDSYNTKIEKTF